MWLLNSELPLDLDQITAGVRVAPSEPESASHPAGLRIVERAELDVL
jgi:hypothetical protein